MVWGIKNRTILYNTGAHQQESCCLICFNPSVIYFLCNAEEVYFSGLKRIGSFIGRYVVRCIFIVLSYKRKCSIPGAVVIGAL